MTGAVVASTNGFIGRNRRSTDPMSSCAVVDHITGYLHGALQPAAHTAVVDHSARLRGLRQGPVATARESFVARLHRRLLVGEIRYGRLLSGRLLSRSAVAVG
jgi:hypothetical protein